MGLFSRSTPTAAQLAADERDAARQHQRGAAELRTAARAVGGASTKAGRALQALAADANDEARQHLRTERAIRSGDIHAGD